MSGNIFHCDNSLTETWHAGTGEGSSDNIQYYTIFSLVIHIINITWVDTTVKINHAKSKRISLDIFDRN